jgi:hypothetical protein
MFTIGMPFHPCEEAWWYAEVAACAYDNVEFAWNFLEGFGECLQ